MEKFKKVIWLQFLLLIPYVIIRTLMLQVFGWQLIAAYLCAFIITLLIASWMLLTYVKSYKNLNIIYGTFLILILIRILIESNFVVLSIYVISSVITIPIWIYYRKQSTTLPYFPMFFYLLIFLFFLFGGWI